MEARKSSGNAVRMAIAHSVATGLDTDSVPVEH